MPGTMSLIISYLLWSLLLLQYSAVAGPNGLTLKLIHRDSVESPLYQGNLTYEERHERLHHQSKARALELLDRIGRGSSSSSSNQSLNPSMVRPPVAFENSLYMVLVGLGTIDAPPPTPSYKSYYLIMDSGSDLIWTQCEGCRAFKCFDQKEPLFPNTQSRTYHPLPCNNHPLCEGGKCIGTACSYEETYLNDAFTQGILASETFTFHSDSGGTESIDNIVFGCGLNNHNFEIIAGNEIAGILGLGGGARSFLNQLGPTGQGRFSHCLQPWTDGTAGSSTFLRFGEDAQIGGGGAIHTTPILTSPFHTVYFLDLQDISVQGKRIGFEPGTFALRDGGQTGGCVIDSGSAYTCISSKPYDRVRRAVEDYFSGFDVHIIQGRVGPFDLCYALPQGFNDMPSITFHFQSSDLEVGPDGFFFSKDEYMCMGIIPLKQDLTILGAYQQTNFRVLYDVGQHQLSFAKEDCTIGA